jgi:glutathione S-transferase
MAVAANGKIRRESGEERMSKATLTITSKNYSSWSLRGWLLCRMAGFAFEEVILPNDDALARAELLLLSPSFLVPRLAHGAITVWDTLAIGEYLAETFPKSGILPEDIGARTLCRAVSGEIHSGFSNLRQALPVNLRAHYPGFRVWAGAQADIDRIEAIFGDCLERSGGPFLFGAAPSLADAMYAPVCTRFRTYDVKLLPKSAAYRDLILAWPFMRDWIAAATTGEQDQLEELDVEF